MLKNEPFPSNQAIQKRLLFEKKSVFIFFLLSYFCTLFAQNGLFATRPHLVNRQLLYNGTFSSGVC